MIERKTSLALGLVIGAAIGSLTPRLWGEAFGSTTSIIWGVVGLVIGFYVAHRLSQ
jgi:hypothetical protein